MGRAAPDLVERHDARAVARHGGWTAAHGPLQGSAGTATAQIEDTVAGARDHQAADGRFYVEAADVVRAAIGRADELRRSRAVLDPFGGATVRRAPFRARRDSAGVR